MLESWGEEVGANLKKRSNPTYTLRSCGQVNANVFLVGLIKTITDKVQFTLKF